MKDPYLKPVVFGGLFIILLSLVFALGIFLWAILGGYLAVRVASKITKNTISIIDGVLLGIFTGMLGGCGLTVITTASFRDYDNQQLLIRTLEKNWPKEMYPIPGFKEMLPSIFLTTCALIILITVLFGFIGGIAGVIIGKKINKKADSTN